MKNILPAPEPPQIHLEIPPTSLAGIGANSKNRKRRRGNDFIDRHPIMSAVIVFGGIVVFVLWLDHLMGNSTNPLNWPSWSQLGK